MHGRRNRIKQGADNMHVHHDAATAGQACAQTQGVAPTGASVPQISQQHKAECISVQAGQADCGEAHGLIRGLCSLKACCANGRTWRYKRKPSSWPQAGTEGGPRCSQGFQAGAACDPAMKAVVQALPGSGQTKVKTCRKPIQGPLVPAPCCVLAGLGAPQRSPCSC